MKNLFNILYAVVHSTVFHADDVFSAAFLKIIRPDLTVYRTCNLSKQIISDIAADKAIAVDIGAQFGVTEYDHHQVDKAYRPIENGTYFDKQGHMSMIPYCGFGLLWRDFGNLLCPYEKAWKKVDRDLVLAIDKADNGVESNMLSAAIHKFNPAWNVYTGNSDADNVLENEAFWKAEQFAEAVLRQYVDNANAEYEAEKLVLESFTVSSGKILVLDKYLPWQDTVINEMPDILFVVYPHKRGGYAVQTVPDAPGSFTGRKPFPERWLGNPDASLGMTFCHPGNFLAAVDTLENAIHVADIAISE